MAQNQRAFSTLVDLDPVLTDVYFQQYEQIPMQLVGQIIGNRTSTKAKETDQRVGTFAEPVPFDGQVAYDTAEQDYIIEYVHEELTRGFKITRSMLEDLQYDGIFDRAVNLGQAFARKRVRDEAAMFNNAFATVTGYDGKTLVATDHPRSKTDSTAVNNSMGTVALTESNLEAALVKLSELGDDLGKETNAMGTHLIVGRNQRMKALKLTGSQLEAESGNNAINTHTSIIPVVHPMITGNKWFVVDAPMALRTAKWYDRVTPEFFSDDDIVNTMVRSYVGRMRYSYGWSDFRWVVGSNAS